MASNCNNKYNTIANSYHSRNSFAQSYRRRPRQGSDSYPTTRMRIPYTYAYAYVYFSLTAIVLLLSCESSSGQLPPNHQQLHPHKLEFEKEQQHLQIQGIQLPSLRDDPKPPPECATSYSSGRSSSSGTHYTSLICWLWNLELAIPDEHFRKGLFSVSIHDMICTNFQITHTVSEYIPGSATASVSAGAAAIFEDGAFNMNANAENHQISDPKLDVQVYGISATCKGEYKSSLAGGTVTVMVDNIDDLPLHTQIAVNSTNVPVLDPQRGPSPGPGPGPWPGPVTNTTIKVPNGASLTTCTTNLQVPPDGGISFTGSISAKFVDLFSNSIAKHVTSALNSEICPRVGAVVEGVVTKNIQGLVDLLVGLIDDDDNNDRHVRDKNDNNDEGHDYDGSTRERKPERGVVIETSNLNTNVHATAVLRKLKHTFSGAIGDALDDNHDVRTTRNIFSDTDEDLIQWNEFSMLQASLESASQFANTHLNKGILIDMMERIGWFDADSSDQDEKGCIDCGYFFRGINGLVHNITNDGELTLKIDHDVDFVVKGVGNVTVSLHNATIGGLDQFSRLGIYPLTSNSSSDDSNANASTILGLGFHPEIGLKDLILDLSVDLKVFPSPDGMIHGNPLDESFSMFLNISDIFLGVDTDVGIIRDRMKNITIGDIIDLYSNTTSEPNPERRWRKLLNTLSHVLLERCRSAIVVNTVEMHASETSDTLEKSMDDAINNALTLVLREFDTLVSKSVEAAFDGPGVDAVNKGLAKLISRSRNQSYSSVHYDVVSGLIHSDYIRFNESIVIKKIHNFLASSKVIGHANAFVACISEFLADNPLKSRSSIRNGLRFFVHNFAFEGIHLDMIDAFKSIDADHLDFAIDMNRANNTTDVGSNDTLTSNLQFDLQYPEEELYATITLDSAMKGLIGKGGTKILYDFDKYKGINLYDLVAEPSSILAALSVSSGLYGYAVNIDKMNVGVNVSLVESGIWREVIFASDDTNEFGRRLSGYLLSLATFAQNALNGMKQLYLGGKLTNKGREGEGAVASSKSQIGIAQNATRIPWDIIVIFTLFLVSNAYFFMKKNTQAMTKKNTTGHSLQFMKRGSGDIPSSLIFHERISNATRIIMPCAIVATVVVFMVSNFSIGASVDIQISGPDGSGLLKIPTITTFSLGKTVREMYHARVYTLMTLVLVFSGIWPYIKLIMMLVSWICPLSVLSFQGREWLLIWLDALGKYSLVDSFVLVLMLVSFKFHIAFPGVATIDSYVIPAFGFYLFLLATILSLVIGHGVTFLHRFTTLPKSRPSSARQSLSRHRFKINNGIEGPRFVRFSRTANICWALITVVCAIFLCIGALDKSFTFEFQGLAGVVLGSERKTSYSLWTLGTSLPNSVEDPNSIGMRIIQYTFFFFALLVPFACLLNVTILFFVPMTLKKQQIVFMLAEIANAWSAVEVFLLSILASMLELSQFAAFMVGDHCDFMKAPFFQDLFQGEDTCFSVKSSVSAGVTYLCVGVGLNNFIVFAGLRLAHAALEDRMLRHQEREYAGHAIDESYRQSNEGDETDEDSFFIKKVLSSKVAKILLETTEYDGIL